MYQLWITSFFSYSIHPTDVSLSLSCPQAILVNDLCIISESPRWQLNLFTAQNCWCVHWEWSVCVGEREEGREWEWKEKKNRKGGREGGDGRKRKMSSLPWFGWRIKREGKLTASLVGSFGSPWLRQYFTPPRNRCKHHLKQFFF